MLTEYLEQVAGSMKAYLRELREGVRLLPEVLRLVCSTEYWASALQRFADRLYTARHFDEWEAWAEEAIRKARQDGH